MFVVSIYICLHTYLDWIVNLLENDPFLRVEGEKFNRACLVLVPSSPKLACEMFTLLCELFRSHQ